LINRFICKKNAPRAYKKGVVHLFLTLLGQAERRIRMKFPVDGTLVKFSCHSGLTFYYLANASPLAFRHLGLTRISTSLLCWEYYFVFSLFL